MEEVFLREISNQEGERKLFRYGDLYPAARELFSKYTSEHFDRPLCFEYTKELINKLGGTIEDNLLELPQISHWAAKFSTENGEFVVDITWSQLSDRFHGLGMHENLKGPLILPIARYLFEIDKISR